MLFYLVYVSSATFNDATSNLNAINSAAQKFNAEHGITGLLLYDTGYFLQILEGEKHEVENLYHRICKDPRNKNNILIEKGELKVRNFLHWTMKTKNITNLSDHQTTSIHQLATTNETKIDSYLRFVFNLLMGELRDEYQMISSLNPAEHVNQETLPFQSLTTREKQVLQLLIKGYTPKKISELLHISHKTVGRHIENMCTKIGCQNKGDLIVRVFTTGYFNQLFLIK